MFSKVHPDARTSAEGRKPSRPVSSCTSRSLARTKWWQPVQAPTLVVAASRQVLEAIQSRCGIPSERSVHVRHTVPSTSVRLRRLTVSCEGTAEGNQRHVVWSRWTGLLHRSDSMSMGSPASRERQPVLAPVASATRSQSLQGQEELGGGNTLTGEPGLWNPDSVRVSTQVVRGSVRGHRRESTPSPVAGTHPVKTRRAHDSGSSLSSVLGMTL